MEPTKNANRNNRKSKTLVAGSQAGSGKSRGFTLIELLVVIAIISLLVSILLPSLNRAREVAKRVVCGSNLKQIGLGMATYAHDHNNKYPYMRTGHWPFGYFCNEYINIYYRYTPGFMGLYSNYVSNADLFFCPSNTRFSREKHWLYDDDRKKSCAGYCYWANYIIDDLTDEVVATGLLSPVSTVVVSDIMTTSHSWSSHVKGDSFDGGNVLFNGGHVEWKDKNQTEERRYLVSRNFWF
ncbi:MAG: type II secretion system GspH family protein [Phycisphaerae bacterium]|nr:type II secretion system GspH family protein [Phycisphaerae bacterium]